MFKLSELYTKKPVATFPNYQAAIDWIGRRAKDWNYGVYRMWPQDGGQCYDVGPRVFFLEEVED